MVRRRAQTRLIIPPRKNAKPWKTSIAGTVTGNAALRRARLPCRSAVATMVPLVPRQTKMGCVELPGQGLMTQGFGRQIPGPLSRLTAIRVQKSVAEPTGTYAQHV